MFFYLKINRREKYTFRNLQHWIDIVEGIEGSDYCILCDNTILQKEVLEQVRFTKEPVAFLESEKQSADLNEIVPNITNADWRNAGYAHLTTFSDAEAKGYPCFWNIDADDTYVHLPGTGEGARIAAQSGSLCKRESNRYNVAGHVDNENLWKPLVVWDYL